MGKRKKKENGGSLTSDSAPSEDSSKMASEKGSKGNRDDASGNKRRKPALPDGQAASSDKLVTIDGTTSADQSTREKSSLRYDSRCRGPFYVLMKYLKSTPEDDRKFSTLDVSRKLYKSNVKFSELSLQAKGCWKVRFESRALANEAIGNPFLAKMGFDLYIPRYFVYRKGVIRGVPVDASVEEIAEIINQDNKELTVGSAFQLNKRNSHEDWVPSETICLEFKCQSVPDSVLMWRSRVFVSPYVPAVRQCYKCGGLGHISKFCMKDERCLECAQSHPRVQDKKCENVAKCVNCLGPHNSRDRSCPSYVGHSNIVRMMALDNVSFAEASRSMSGGAGTLKRAPSKTKENFPDLPKGPPIRGSSYSRIVSSPGRAMSRSSTKEGEEGEL